MTEVKQTVKEWWWEGRNLHIITDEDKHTVYTEAVFVSQETILEGSDTILVEPVTFNAERVDSPGGVK